MVRVKNGHLVAYRTPKDLDEYIMDLRFLRSYGMHHIAAKYHKANSMLVKRWRLEGKKPCSF